MERVGFIGVGAMGAPMAGRLAEAGFAVTAVDPDPAALERARRAGLSTATSPAEVAADADVLVLSLPTQEVLEEVLCGPDGVLRADVTGKAVLDTTTAMPSLVRRLATEVDRHGAVLLDSPVTGGVAGAEAGTLSVMVGGDAAAFDRHRRIYETIASTVVHIGPSGHGQVAKLVNQMLMGAIYASVAESFAFAASLGVDVERVYDAVEHGGGQSALLSAARADLVSGRRTVSGNLVMHGKDLRYAVQEALHGDAFVPVTSTVNEIWKLARIRGLTDVAAKDLYALWEDLRGEELRRLP